MSPSRTIAAAKESDDAKALHRARNKLKRAKKRRAAQVVEIEAKGKGR
jgi:hypothetical protein